MISTRMFALVAGAALLLVPAAQAEQKDPFRPASSSIMLGAFFPENTALNSEFAFFLTQGLMVNRHVGCQAEIGGFATSDDRDVVTMAEGIGVSLKLALPVAFLEPYLLAGAGLDLNNWGFPVHAAVGVNINFDTLQIGVEARQVWHEADGLNVDGLMLMEKIGFRF